MIEFIKCIFTGLGELAKWVIIIGLVVAPIGFIIWGVGTGYEKLTERSEVARRIGKRVGTGVKWTLGGCLICTFTSLIIIGFHDWGCSIKGHPEHQIFKEREAKPCQPVHEHKP